MSNKQLCDAMAEFDAAQEGAALYESISSLYPICRSITGDGLRQSIGFLRRCVPLTIKEVASGTQVFDWTVPKEWNVRDAYIRNSRGTKILDFEKCNLHVLNYSLPVNKRLRLSELREHVFTLPEQPDWIPYRTSYYRETWGFCMSQRQWDRLEDGVYEVCVDSTLRPGHLTYGEYYIGGAIQDEVLISAHSCHPSLCNDNLSGMTVAARLAELLSGVALRYSYRFLWIPGTIGAITWLALNEAVIPRIRHGLVLSCLGDAGKFTYKRSRRGDAEIDRAVECTLRHSGHNYELINFSPYGYDERQYCSPGFNLPVGCFMRTPNGKYPEYHTSADDLSLIKPAALAESLYRLLHILLVLETNFRYQNLNPKCEPQLGRRGLYRQMGGTSSSELEEALLWVLNLSDGAHSLLDIAERSPQEFGRLDRAARLLLKYGLLERVE